MLKEIFMGIGVATVAVAGVALATCKMKVVVNGKPYYWPSKEEYDKSSKEADEELSEKIRRVLDGEDESKDAA